ncbi:MAG TPA: septum formation protein Maf [Candidatus Caccousia stercoris]|uniref:dTTP/UTP pyrophosphatase n=1 Tax=Candidatus Caccousia stercoris TaxID=2840723 RepID=A0A9D1FSD3_9FIRM|nr:septum formation protein Maf [Candidatus Caccousia stercoris]
MLYLASASPRRKELLTLAGYSFTVLPANADETAPLGLSPRETAGLLARRKAEAVQALPEFSALQKPGDVILAADTVVDLGGKILGKPKDREDAKRTLLSLSGRRHSVHTGFCVLAGAKKMCGVESTAVEFYPLTQEEIETYLDTGEPMDKAGAYGIQGRGALFVRRISGDYYTVVGLPIARVDRILRALSV